ncbi:MAG: hypothetical protein ACRDTD_09500 [Pseudonocardiaceae bacterium]
MVDLKVNYPTLDHSERSLQRIATELEGADTRRDANAGIWGSSDVADAMSDFVDNWDYHRTKLLESLKNVGGMCASARETFAGSDRQLAAELTRAGEG